VDAIVLRTEIRGKHLERCNETSASI